MLKKILISLAVILTALTACNQTDTGTSGNNKPLQGQLTSYSECKTFIDTLTSKSDCIEYNYDTVTKVLTLKHINAGFNCCPGSISADIGIDKNLITISEKEAKAGCKCECLYDIDYKFTNVTASNFVIRVVEPYLPQGDEAIVVSISLSEKTYGKVCFNRAGYPW